MLTEHIEEKLNFKRIREHIVERCLCTLGIQRVLEMQFSTVYADILRWISETDEMMRILELGDFPDAHFYDVRTALKRLRIENTYIETDELLQLGRSLHAIYLIVNYLNKEDGEVLIYPRLAKKCENIQTYPALVKKIQRVIDESGEILDGASTELARIRREKRSVSNKISGLLTRILKNAQTEGLVEKNASPTFRDGRLMIPVAPAMKRKIGGIVHDESDSGRTVYIEPTEVVEANNHIRELENDERKEILRILKELSAEIRPFADDMLQSYEFLADVDFIHAKALFSRRIHAIRPQLLDKQLIDWSQAVHPLLHLSLEKRGQKVVPLDVELKDPNQRILLISGPNAGGKSVCLKTVGLLQYMLQCGLPIPLAESSRCGIFKSIFIDIGDEQSIEDDLSTYSSHLLNMKVVLRHSDAKSLLLIDEFGGGTEPQIGGAIAEALLKRFNYKHAFGVITTHYQNLKHLAQETDGIINGAMLYDRQEMRPLFQLRIGNPGSSFAIDIARKIGIPDDVIQDASDIVGRDYIDSDRYLQDIVRDKRYWENKRQSIHQHEKKMEQTIERYEADIQRLQNEKKEILARAKEQAQQLLNESNARIEQTIREIREAQAEKERTKDIRKDFADFKQEVRSLDTEYMEERVRRQMEKIKARQQRRIDKKKNAKPTPETVQPKPAADDVLTEGMYVRMKGQSVVGQIQKIHGDEALVVFGSIQTNVKLKKLEASEPPKKEKRADTFVSRETQDNIRETSLNFKPEIDLRGMRADEALQAVTYFVDEALVASVSRVSILHGTGNGILRTLVRQYLSTLPAVADFHDEHPQFGGAGITVVDLM